MRSILLRRRTLSGLLASVLLLAACDSPTGVPIPAEVAGSYRATVLTTRAGGAVVDQLAGGTELRITLDPSGATTGRLFVPHGDENGRDLDADLAGRWTLRGDTVRFEQQADTFVRDIPFLVREDRLEGAADFGPVRIEVSLARS